MSRLNKGGGKKNRHLRRLILGLAWGGLAMGAIGAFMSIPVACIGIGLIIGVVVLWQWTKKHKPIWYEALK